MNFKLSAKAYYLLVIIIWLSYTFMGAYYIDTIRTRVTVVYEILIVAGIMQLSVMSFIRNWYKKGSPNLVDWFAFTTFYVIIFNYFSLIDKLDGPIIWGYGTIYLKQNLIIPSLLVVLIGLFALRLGELFVFFITLNKFPIFFGKGSVNDYLIRNKAIFYFVCLGVFFFQLYLLFSGKIGYGTYGETAVSGISFLLILASSLSVFFLLLMGYYKYFLKKSDPLFNVVYFVSLGLSIIFGMFSGMKEFTLIPIICFILPFFRSKNVIPKKFMVISVLVLIFIYPLNDNYRAILTKYHSFSKTEAFSLAFAKTINTDFTQIFNESSDSFTNRLAMFPLLQYSLEIEPDWNEYKNMNRFVYLPVSFLPRFLVPSKPLSDTGGILNKKISGDDKSSVTPTTYGWAYFEGGIIFVFVEFIMLGLVLSFIQNFASYGSLFRLIFYGKVLIMVLKVETDIYFILASLLQDLIVFYIFYRLLIRENRFLMVDK